eukprot:EG_transcript_12595
MLSSLSLPCGADVRVEWTGSRAARAALKLLQSHHRQLAVQVDNGTSPPTAVFMSVSPGLHSLPDVSHCSLAHPTPSSPASSDSSVGTHGPFDRSPPLTPVVTAPPVRPRWSCRSIDCHRLRLIMKTDVIAELYATPQIAPLLEIPPHFTAEPSDEGCPTELQKDSQSPPAPHGLGAHARLLPTTTLSFVHDPYSFNGPRAIC